jgi:RNA polymerase sigma-70 factor (ECF subfamily)
MAEPWAAARAAWPDVTLSAATFGVYLKDRGLALEAEHVTDLYLACACLEQQPAALRAFEATHLAHVPELLSRLRPSPQLIDEVKQRLRQKLFLGEAPKIAEYSGKGPLMSWLRVVAVRTAIDLSRGDQDHKQETLPELADVATSPELQALRNRYRPLFKRVMATALQRQSKSDRTLLKLHFIDGISLAELGRMLNVNRSTVHRRLAACTRAVLESVQEQLREELGISTEELRSLAGLLRSDVELTLTDNLRSQLDTTD